VEREKRRNEELRTRLVDPAERVHDEAVARTLVEQTQALQDDIAAGKKQRLELEAGLYPKAHRLNMERHRIRMLQVEIGEMSVLLSGIRHDRAVERRVEARGKDGRRGDGRVE
jgi:hypothetical protein